MTFVGTASADRLLGRKGDDCFYATPGQQIDVIVLDTDYSDLFVI